MSIKHLINTGKKIGEKEINAIRTRLRDNIIWPSPVDSQTLQGKINTVFSMQISKFDYPVIDLFHGKIVEPSPEDKHLPMVFSFPGTNGRIYVPVHHDINKSTIHCMVPPKAISGTLELFVPVKETLGSKKNILQLKEILGIKPLPHSPESFDTDICPPIPWPPEPFDEPQKWKWSIVERVRYIEDYLRRGFPEIILGCYSCTVGCPNGAISLDALGRCTVDPDICQGQKFYISRQEHELTPDGQEVYKRGDEDICFECFEGRETYSLKCQVGILRRSLHHNGICCGSCGSLARRYGLTLMELCSHNAITNVSGAFVVDKDECVGCRTCYNGINCVNNVEAGNPCCTSGPVVANDAGNYTIRMTAYADYHT